MDRAHRRRKGAGELRPARRCQLARRGWRDRRRQGEGHKLPGDEEIVQGLPIRAEFWAERNTNSGVFIRIQNPKKIGADSSYEVNIYDQRPGPEYGTAGIVNFAKVPVPPVYKAEGKWNTFEITAKGSTITVVFNGQKTVELQDSKFPQGPFALQFGNHGKQPGDVIKWRKVQVREL
ncbi:MAG TPA: DUF1080 domain-containing protein [Burkholderiales bacterium]|nr:DUF1080 domain-containing protein [Burkholderiales bacterium]